MKINSNKKTIVNNETKKTEGLPPYPPIHNYMDCPHKYTGFLSPTGLTQCIFCNQINHALDFFTSRFPFLDVRAICGDKNEQESTTKTVFAIIIRTKKNNFVDEERATRYTDIQNSEYERDIIIGYLTFDLKHDRKAEMKNKYPFDKPFIEDYTKVSLRLTNDFVSAFHELRTFNEGHTKLKEYLEQCL